MSRLTLTLTLALALVGVLQESASSPILAALHYTNRGLGSCDGRVNTTPLSKISPAESIRGHYLLSKAYTMSTFSRLHVTSSVAPIAVFGPGINHHNYGWKEAHY